MNPKIQNNTVVLFNEMRPFRKVLYEHISTKITILKENRGKIGSKKCFNSQSCTKKYSSCASYSYDTILLT